MKKSVLLGVTLAAMSLPNIAIAHCGDYKKGSFNVSCESGVQVYRQDAKKLPRVDPNVQARLEVSRLNNRTQQEAIASRERIANQNAAIQSRRVESDAFFSRSLVENPRNLSRLGFNNGFNNSFNRFGTIGLGAGRFGSRGFRGNRHGITSRRGGFIISD